jgi:phosphoserine phosphatase RsbU/P
MRAELWPQSRLARLTGYGAALAVALLILEVPLRWIAPSWAEPLSGWVDFLAVLTAIFLFILAFRWVRRRILWRLRNRLIVTYVFIGVIPAVLLVAMALITLYGLGGQFAVFVVTSEIHTQLRSLEAVNAAVSNELAARLERGEKPAAESLTGLRKRDPAWGRRQVCAWYAEKPLPLCNDFQGASLTPPAFVKGKFQDIVRDQNQLHLRVAHVMAIGANTLTVVTSEPFDKELVGKIAEDLGEISLYRTGFAFDELPARQEGAGAGKITVKTQSKSGVVVSSSGANGQNPEQVLHADFSVGMLPESMGSFDREITFGTPLAVVDWKTGEPQQVGAVLQVTTRPAVLYTHLFAALGEFVRGVAYILAGVAIFFAIIELIALIIGTRMTRTVTAAIAQLHDATKHVDHGDFSHRIPVKSNDQLADLAHSFNSMTASIEKLILEQKEKQRLENELAIAQQVQAQLLPQQASELESLEVHGFYRPARTVSGDYYDFLAASSHKLILAVGDISGKGISAALLMATIHSAVRAYSVESLPQIRERVAEPLAVGAVAGVGKMMSDWPEGIEVSPGALLGLLNHQLYESTPPEKYATLFLGVYDGRARTLTYSNGGHLPPILVGTDGSVRRLEAGGTVVGLFDHMTYSEDTVEMNLGEILIAYSDGVTEPENEFGEFGEERLIELVRTNRNLSLPQISQAVSTAVDNWIGDMEQPDDVTLVLARAR